MKVLMSRFVVLIAVLVFGVVTARADYTAESNGASPAASNNTPAIQTTLDAAGAAGGGVVTITTPGIYLLHTQGANPYLGGHRYCLDIRYDNITLRIGQGVVLKLADGQQSTQPVDIVVFRGRRNLAFEGYGTITGNTAGQSWSGGYTQIDYGIIISGYGNADGANHHISISGLTLSDHFSNSINIDSAYGITRNTNIRIRDVKSFDCGEGIQVIRADDVWIEGCFVDSPNHVAVGDGIEVSDVTKFHISGNTARNLDYGSAFDIFGSRHGIVQDFISESCASGIIVHPFTGTAESENVLLQNGIILAPPGTGISTGVELAGALLKNITVSNVKIRGTPTSYGFQGPADGNTLKAQGPVNIIDCEVTGALDGILFQPISNLTIRGGSYSNNVGRGIVLLYVQNLNASDVAGLRIDGVNASGNGSYGILIDRQGYTVPNLTGSITNCVLNNTAGSMSIGSESVNLVLRDNIS